MTCVEGGRDARAMCAGGDGLSLDGLGLHAAWLNLIGIHASEQGAKHSTLQTASQVNVTYQSAWDPVDPFIVGLRNEGRLMAHRHCNGTLLPG